MIFNVLSGVKVPLFAFKNQKRKIFKLSLFFFQLFFIMFFVKNKTVIPIILDGHNMEKMFGHTYSEGTGDSLFLLFYTHAPYTCA